MSLHSIAFFRGRSIDSNTVVIAATLANVPQHTDGGPGLQPITDTLALASISTRFGVCPLAYLQLWSAAYTAALVYAFFACSALFPGLLKPASITD
jgi:hypothetical protein